MAEARLRFGTKSSADVKLFLTGPGEEKYGKNPVYLHSQILKRLKCFEGKFSARWEPYESTEIRVSTSHKFDHYLKCIEIMYGEHVHFPNIEECLAILSVASEMSANECIDKYMQYLGAVGWRAEEESQIRKVLSSDGLKLKILPDLAARLHEDEDEEHINFVEKSIQEMVTLVKGNTSSKSRETAEKDLVGMLDGNASRDVVDICGRVVLQEFKASIGISNITALTHLFKLIQHCDGGILEAALKAFSEDAEFIKSLETEYRRSYCLFLKTTGPSVFDIVTWFMKATGEGKIIISRASRVSLLTTWLPIMGKFNVDSMKDKSGQLDKAVLKVVLSLPRVDQKKICLLWVEVYRSRHIGIATPFILSKHLQNAHTKSTEK